MAGFILLEKDNDKIRPNGRSHEFFRTCGTCSCHYRLPKLGLVGVSLAADL